MKAVESIYRTSLKHVSFSLGSSKIKMAERKFHIGDLVIAVETGCPGMVVGIKGKTRYLVRFNPMIMGSFKLKPRTIDVSCRKIRMAKPGEWYDGVFKQVT